MSLSDVADEEDFFQHPRASYFHKFQQFLADGGSPLEDMQLYAVATIAYHLEAKGELFHEFATLTTLSAPLVEPLEEWFRKYVAQPVLRFRSRFLDGELLFIRYHWK